MKHSEIAKLLGAIAATDNRTVGNLDIETWAAILPDDMTLADAQSAVIHHRRTNTDWLMPKHIIDTVGAVRRERLTRAGTPPMPGDLTHAQERDWRQLWCAKVKDGESPEAAARAASEAMRLPLELEPAALDAEERQRLITKLAESKGIPREVRRKRKRVEYVDDTQPGAAS